MPMPYSRRVKMFESLIPNLMHLKRMSAKDLERKLGISYPTALSIAQGDVPKTTPMLLKLCKEFNCQLNYLVRFKKERE